VLDGRLCLAVKQFKELEEAETVRSSKRMVVEKQAVPPRDARRRLMSKDTNLGALADDFMGGVSRDGASVSVSGGRGGLAKASAASDSSGDEALRGRGRSVEVWLRAYKMHPNPHQKHPPILSFTRVSTSSQTCQTCGFAVLTFVVLQLVCLPCLPFVG
jgi:hypothetical protein